MWRVGKRLDYQGEETANVAGAPHLRKAHGLVDSRDGARELGEEPCVAAFLLKLLKVAIRVWVGVHLLVIERVGKRHRK